MTEETGNGGTVRSLASICFRAIFRSKAKVMNDRYGMEIYFPSSSLCQSAKFERFVRDLILPESLKVLMMSYPEKNCNTGCRYKKTWATRRCDAVSRFVKWRASLNQPGCALAYGCDCCTCHHGTSCHCEHCGQSFSEEASAADSGEDEESDGWESSDHSEVGSDGRESSDHSEVESDGWESSDHSEVESDGWESSDHSEVACTNSKCDAYSPCNDCTKNTDEDEDEQYDSSEGGEEEQDDSTDGEEEDKQDGSTNGEEQEENIDD